MPTLLLKTKFYIPPARPEQVSRPRLLRRLHADAPCKLILVSAPAGFGKTTLLSEWTADYNRRMDADGLQTNDVQIRNSQSEIASPGCRWVPGIMIRPVSGLTFSFPCYWAG